VTVGLAQAEIRDRLDRLVAEIATPTPVAGRDLLLTASVGVAFYPRDGTRPETLLQRASQALQASRVQGGNRWQAFDPALDGQTETSPFLESDLRHAIQDQDLTLYFQPQFELSSKRAVSVEALVRWVHPEHGMLLPGAFIPMAEQTGLIEAMDLWVIRETCRQLAKWRRSGQSVARASVNLSARGLYNKGLPQYIGDCLAEFDLPPLSLTLELTETMLMESPDRARQVLEQIKSLGVRISMDDFGTGYSNLAYLAQLPIDEVKLDQSLVRELDHSNEVKTLLQGMISLFDRLGLALVAEGIETEEQLRFLIEAGCRTGQGFLLGRPAPA
jgi:EAL domain-containing protein (putative c-di-GMP-specific phosphodiesterase class I)